MKKYKILFAAAMLLLTACVTINIYFPAAEAREAAEKIVDDVLGKDAKKPAAPAPAPGKDDQSMDMRLLEQGYAMSLLDLLISPAEAAQPNFDADTPTVRKLQASMKQRHAQLKAFYDNGAIGFTQDALVGIHDLSAVPLKQRGEVKNLLGAETTTATSSTGRSPAPTAIPNGKRISARPSPRPGSATRPRAGGTRMPKGPGSRSSID